MGRLKKIIPKRVKHINVEGNKGCDFVSITQNKEQEDNSTCHLKVGHCCVVIINAVVPVEFLTAVFAFFESNVTGDSLSERLINGLPWSKDYNIKLAEKVNEKKWIF